MDTITLNNGVLMPQIGLGTFQIPLDRLDTVIGQAYELGYRKFDMAWKYGNEAAVSAALKKNGIRREDVFLTTKVNADALYIGGCHAGKRGLLDVRNFKSIRQVIETSFRNLNTDYIDLFLIHWPWPVPVAQRIYAKLTELYMQGRIRAIGVCSSLPAHLKAFSDVSDVVPAVNQFEISPLNTQKELIRYCQDRGIAVEGMSTFSHFRDTKTRREIVDNERIAPIAQHYGKTIPQVILRWLVQQGISIIPKSSNKDRLAQNISIFDFSLSPEEMAVLDSLDQGHFLNYKPDLTLTAAYALWGRFPEKYRTTGWD